MRLATCCCTLASRVCSRTNRYLKKCSTLVTHRTVSLLILLGSRDVLNLPEGGIELERVFKVLLGSCTCAHVNGICAPTTGM